MKKKDNMPIIVYLGLCGISSKSTAYLYATLCIIIGIVSIFMGIKNPQYFYGTLLFIAAYWYFYCIKWIDKNSNWDK